MGIINQWPNKPTNKTAQVKSRFSKIKKTPFWSRLEFLVKQQRESLKQSSPGASKATIQSLSHQESFFSFLFFHGDWGKTLVRHFGYLRASSFRFYLFILFGLNFLLGLPACGVQTQKLPEAPPPKSEQSSRLCLGRRWTYTVSHHRVLLLNHGNPRGRYIHQFDNTTTDQPGQVRPPFHGKHAQQVIKFEILRMQQWCKLMKRKAAVVKNPRDG